MQEKLTSYATAAEFFRIQVIPMNECLQAHSLPLQEDFFNIAISAIAHSIPGSEEFYVDPSGWAVSRLPLRDAGSHHLLFSRLKPLPNPRRLRAVDRNVQDWDMTSIMNWTHSIPGKVRPRVASNERVAETTLPRLEESAPRKRRFERDSRNSQNTRKMVALSRWMTSIHSSPPRPWKLMRGRLSEEAFSHINERAQ